MLDDHLEELAKKVIGAALEVHKILGPGYLESVYEEAFSKELSLREIPFERQKSINVGYKGFNIGEGRLDFLIEKELIVELKAVDSLTVIHTAQVISYLKTTDLKLGLLINFKVLRLKEGIKRIILD
jgi:GxxExxY protein